MSFFDKLKSLFGGGTNGAPTGNGAGAGDVEMISCHEALILVHEYLDGELADVPEAQVRAHFEVCERCYPHLHLETVFRTTVRRAAGREHAPPELKAKIAQLLAEERQGD